MYVRDGNSNQLIKSEMFELKKGEWSQLRFKIPSGGSLCIEEAGIMLVARCHEPGTVVAYVDDFDFSGKPDYRIDFSKERNEKWSRIREVPSQFTILKGNWSIENGFLRGSCADFAETYTGDIGWSDYSFSAVMLPKIGSHHRMNFRVQGGIRSYALSLMPEGKLAVLKNENGYKKLKEIDFQWVHEKEYGFKVTLAGSKISIFYDGKMLFEVNDSENPYLTGQIGASIEKGSCCCYKDFVISSGE